MLDTKLKKTLTPQYSAFLFVFSQNIGYQMRKRKNIDTLIKCVFICLFSKSWIQNETKLLWRKRQEAKSS